MKPSIWLGFMRGLLAIVFIIAGISKLMVPLAFADGIVSFRLVPAFLINSIAVGLPLLELATAGLLLSPKFKREGALLSVSLTTAFLVFYGWALTQGIEVKCHCFGSGHMFEVTTLQGTIRAAVMFFISIGLYFWLSIEKGKFANQNSQLPV